MADEQRPDTQRSHCARALRSTLPFSLRLADREVLWGDETSVGVIFNNLTGRNFACATNHADYLAYMAKEIKADLSDGVEVAWGANGGAVLETAVIRRGTTACAACSVCCVTAQSKTTAPSAAPIMHCSTSPVL